MQKQSTRPRIGLGYDLHRLESGTGLRLGGVDLPCDLRSVAHSDGDALLHALTDAILGALAEPDIGELFPDSADENRDRDSTDFLDEACRRMRDRGYAVGNVDIVVHLQQPKVGPYKDAIRGKVAELLACEADSVGVKAKTGETLGPIGSGQAVGATVIVLLAERAA